MSAGFNPRSWHLCAFGCFMEASLKFNAFALLGFAWLCTIVLPLFILHPHPPPPPIAPSMNGVGKERSEWSNYALGQISEEICELYRAAFLPVSWEKSPLWPSGDDQNRSILCIFSLPVLLYITYRCRRENSWVCCALLVLITNRMRYYTVIRYHIRVLVCPWFKGSQLGAFCP